MADIELTITVDEDVVKRFSDFYEDPSGPWRNYAQLQDPIEVLSEGVIL